MGVFVSFVLDLNPFQLAIAAGILAVSLVFFWRLARRKTVAITLPDVVMIILEGAGVVAGVRVAILSFSDQLTQVFPNDPIYIFIGGVAVVWVSIKGLWKKMTAD